MTAPVIPGKTAALIDSVLKPNSRGHHGKPYSELIHCPACVHWQRGEDARGVGFCTLRRKVTKSYHYCAKARAK